MDERTYLRELRKSNGAVPLYGFRPVLNGEEVQEWAKAQGFSSMLEIDDLHVTTLFSRRAFSVELSAAFAKGWENVVAKPVGLKKLGKEGEVTVLELESQQLHDEWQMFRDMGASWDYESYIPHMTLTYTAGAPDTVDVLPEAIVLGGGQLREFGAPSEIPEISLSKNLGEGRILKVDNAQRIVYGWASVTTVKGEALIDKHGDIISTETMEAAATEFMLTKRTGKAMHEGEQVGEIVHSLPVTDEIAKLLGIWSPVEGWIVAMKVFDDDVWKRVEDGELRAFSIGGKGKRVAV